ncbi:MAG: hypothetical protein FWG02_08505 [Holophagaceae bacterium]|nr:hypothetical protein [Holophagaceae bacterium]
MCGLKEIIISGFGIALIATTTLKADDGKGIRFDTGISLVQPFGNSSLLGPGFGPFLTAEKHLTDKHALRTILGYTRWAEGKEHFGAELHRNIADRLEFGAHWVYYLNTDTLGFYIFGGAGVINEIGKYTRSDIDGNLYSNNYNHFSPVLTAGVGYIVGRHTFEISTSFSEVDSYIHKFQNYGLSSVTIHVLNTLMNPNYRRDTVINPDYRLSTVMNPITNPALPIVDPNKVTRLDNYQAKPNR